MASYKNVMGASALVACTSLCAGFEGLYTSAYIDHLAYSKPPTVCYGETEGVKMGDKYTPQECKDMLAKKLPRYWNEIQPCIHVRISDNETVAYTDFAYNVGSGAFCKSSLLKKLNAGDHEEACEGLMQWVHAGGKEWPGLVRRRAAERDWCLRPDPKKPQVSPATQVAPTKPTVFPSDLSPTVTVTTPEPVKLVCRGWWFWRHCS